jgi:hypothetical protein
MNPYLEQEDVWHDFHHGFMPLAREQLTRQVDPEYLVKIDEQVFKHKLPAVEFESQSFLEIRNGRNRQVVTVIELLSPSNKYSGPDRDQYLAKRAQLLCSRVHLVEIDLLRGGPRMPVESGMPDCDYCVLVSRVERRPRAGVWPIRLRDKLPEIPIPLRDPHPDAKLDLQAVLHRIYDTARYERYIYDSEPVPALSAEDAAWARQFLPQR